MAEGDTLINALVGAVATVLLTFLPFSPVLGGAVAGYLQRGDTREGAKVGAVSGLIASLPVFLVAFLLVSLFTFVPARESLLFAISGIFIALFVVFVVALYVVGLSVLGGVLGVYIRNETDLGGA